VALLSGAAAEYLIGRRKARKPIVREVQMDPLLQVRLDEQTASNAELRDRVKKLQTLLQEAELRNARLLAGMKNGWENIVEKGVSFVEYLKRRKIVAGLLALFTGPLYMQLLYLGHKGTWWKRLKYNLVYFLLAMPLLLILLGMIPYSYRSYRVIMFFQAVVVIAPFLVNFVLKVIDLIRICKEKLQPADGKGYFRENYLEYGEDVSFAGMKLYTCDILKKFAPLIALALGAVVLAIVFAKDISLQAAHDISAFNLPTGFIGVGILIGVCSTIFNILFSVWEYRVVRTVRLITYRDDRFKHEYALMWLCPFYSIYWYSTRASMLKEAAKTKDIEIIDHSLLHFVLSLSGLHFVNLILLQKNINTIAEQSGLSVEKTHVFRLAFSGKRSIYCAESLEKLAALRQQGAITEEEYAAKKAEILYRM